MSPRYKDERKELLEEMQARLQTEEGKKKYLKRLRCEGIFGHIKHNLGYRQFLLRGIEKVKGEFNLMCIAYNLRRMNNIIGAKQLAIG